MTKNKVLTLAFIRKAGEVLLGFKKRGFGAGRWNGFGGKVESGETIEEGARRELNEECGAVVDRLEEIGVLMFEFIGQAQLWEVHVFQTHIFSGTIVETEEMRPKWYSEQQVPYADMWPDDYLWYPLMFRGDKFYGYFLFDGMDKFVNTELRKVDNLDDIVIPQSSTVTETDLYRLNDKGKDVVISKSSSVAGSRVDSVENNSKDIVIPKSSSVTG